MNNSELLRQRIKDIVQQRKEERDSIHQTFKDTLNELITAIKENEFVKVLEEAGNNNNTRHYINGIEVSGSIGSSKFTVEMNNHIELGLALNKSTLIQYVPAFGHFVIRIRGVKLLKTFELSHRDLKNIENILDEYDVGVVKSMCTELDGLLGLIRDKGILEIAEEKLLEELYK